MTTKNNNCAKNADAVYVLPNYKGSTGVAVELALSKSVQIPIEYLRRKHAKKTKANSRNEQRTNSVRSSHVELSIK
jgi:hypothetical protein